LIFKLIEEKKNMEKACTTEHADVRKCINDPTKRLLENKNRIKDDSVEQMLVLSAFLPFYKELLEGYLREVE
jgi:hypothetical protein